MAKRKLCPWCDSPDIVRRPKSDIAPHPGYECRACEAILRPEGYGFVYVVVLVICLTVPAFLAKLYWDKGEFEAIPVVVSFSMVSMAVYAVRELFRPAPRHVDEEREVSPPLDS
jgi:hypothetical protein